MARGRKEGHQHRSKRFSCLRSINQHVVDGREKIKIKNRGLTIYRRHGCLQSEILFFPDNESLYSFAFAFYLSASYIDLTPCRTMSLRSIPMPFRGVLHGCKHVGFSPCRGRTTLLRPLVNTGTFPAQTIQLRYSSYPAEASPADASGPVPPRKKVTINTIRSMYRKKEPITMLTAHDFPSAQVAEAAGMDIVLIGDSLAMVAMGMEDTSEIVVEDIILHCRSVARGAKAAFKVSPFLDFQFLATPFCRTLLTYSNRLATFQWGHMKHLLNKLCKQPFESSKKAASKLSNSKAARRWLRKYTG